MSIKNGKAVAEAVEKYGKADEQEKKAKALKKEARKELEKLLKVGEQGRSAHFIVTAGLRVNRILDKQAVHGVVGTEEYIRIAEPKLGLLEDLVGKAKVDELTEEFSETRTFSAKRHK